MELFDNQYYKVVLIAGNLHYSVINKETGMVESEDKGLPTAIHRAIALNNALEKIISEYPNANTNPDSGTAT